MSNKVERQIKALVWWLNVLGALMTIVAALVSWYQTKAIKTSVRRSAAWATVLSSVNTWFIISKVGK